MTIISGNKIYLFYRVHYHVIKSRTLHFNLWPYNFIAPIKRIINNAIKIGNSNKKYCSGVFSPLLAIQPSYNNRRMLDENVRFTNDITAQLVMGFKSIFTSQSCNALYVVPIRCTWMRLRIKCSERFQKLFCIIRTVSRTQGRNEFGWQYKYKSSRAKNWVCAIKRVINCGDFNDALIPSAQTEWREGSGRRTEFS